MTHDWPQLLAELQDKNQSRRAIAIRRGLSKDRLYRIAFGAEPTFAEGSTILEEHEKYCRGSAIDDTHMQESGI